MPKHSQHRKWLQNREDPMVTFVWVQLTLQLVCWVLPPAVCVGPQLSDSLSDRTNAHIVFSLSEASIYSYVLYWNTTLVILQNSLWRLNKKERKKEKSSRYLLRSFINNSIINIRIKVVLSHKVFNLVSLLIACYIMTTIWKLWILSITEFKIGHPKLCVGVLLFCSSGAQVEVRIYNPSWSFII